MKNYLNIFVRGDAAVTPQSQSIANTVPNSAGGYAFAIDDWARLDRFLILGSEGGSYYAGERVLTRENAAAILRANQAGRRYACSPLLPPSSAPRPPMPDVVGFDTATPAVIADFIRQH